MIYLIATVTDELLCSNYGEICVRKLPGYNTPFRMVPSVVSFTSPLTLFWETPLFTSFQLLASSQQSSPFCVNKVDYKLIHVLITRTVR